MFALRWRDEIKRSSQLRTLLKRVVENRTWKKKFFFRSFFQLLISSVWTFIKLGGESLGDWSSPAPKYLWELPIAFGRYSNIKQTEMFTMLLCHVWFNYHRIFLYCDEVFEQQGQLISRAGNCLPIVSNWIFISFTLYMACF